MEYRVFFYALHILKTIICKEVISIKLPKKTLILWGARLIAADFPVLLIGDLLFDLDIWEYLMIAVINIFICTLLCVKYLNTRLYLAPCLILESGFLIKKHTIIKLCKVYGTKQIRTPISTVLGLSALVIYCEGKRFPIPPITLEHCEKTIELINKTKREVCKN